jgi:hypothetical protein
MPSRLPPLVVTGRTGRSEAYELLDEFTEHSADDPEHGTWQEHSPDAPTTLLAIGGVCSRIASFYHQPATQHDRTAIVAAAETFAQSFASAFGTEFRLKTLEKAILELRYAVRRLEERRTIHVPVETLAPDTLVLLKPITIVVQPDDDQFIATFFDANINASGDTQVEAVDNLKATVCSQFRRFSELGEDRLGPGPAKQLATLRGVIREA